MDTQLIAPVFCNGLAHPVFGPLVKPRHTTEANRRLTSPVLGRATLRSPGTFEFQFQAPTGAAFLIQASSDLRTWSDLQAGTSRGDIVRFADSAASEFSYRFYRVRLGALLLGNVVGYASVSLPPGYSMISNPFRGDQTVQEQFPNWANGTRLTRYDAESFRLVDNRVERGQWAQPAARLGRGEGALFFNPTFDHRSASFVGEVPDGIESVMIPPGISIRGSPLPLPGTLDDLQFPIEDGDVVHRFDSARQRYVLHPFEAGAWSRGPAVVSVGESFWVAKSKPAVWSVELNLFKAGWPSPSVSFEQEQL